MLDVDAVVIGSGPNGLVAACELARRGWNVLVCEQAAAPGGGVRSDQGTLPGFVHDHCAGFFPMGAVSRHFTALDLRGAGLRWLNGEVETAHPRPDGSAVWMTRDLEGTVRSLEADTPGDGERWREVFAWLRTVERPLLDTMLNPIPDLPAAARLLWTLRVRGLLRLTRMALTPVRDLADQEFGGPGAGQLLAGLALHADLGPEQVGTGVYGLVLAYLAQTVGFPVAAGGSQTIADALIARLRGWGGEVRCSAEVTKVIVRSNRAVAVRVEGVGEVGVRHAVMADTGAPRLLLDLVGEDHLPASFLHGLRRFRHGLGVFKADWALSGPVPWTNDACRRAATVHLGDDVNDLSRAANEAIRGLLPSYPYLILGQQSLLDPSRAPAGQHTLWGYTHVPVQPTGDAEGKLGVKWDEVREGFCDRVEERIEAMAPGFRDRILARRILSPPDMQRDNPNLVGGDHSGGTMQPHQLLVFRPVPGWFRYRMPVKGLYLASASAHPGGAVHGACGAGAAKMALRDRKLKRI